MPLRSARARLASVLVAGVASLCTLAWSERPARAAEELRLGTLAPRDSVWGRTLGAWSAAVQQESGGQLKVTIYYGGSQGDEVALAAKVKDRTLDGAALSGSGLSAFAPDVAALELPQVLGGWPKLDRARNSVRAGLGEAFARAGVRLLAEGETGVMRIFSRGAPVRVPRDLLRMRPFLRADDRVGRSFFDGLGLLPPTLAVTQVFGALLPPRAPEPTREAGAPLPHVDVVFASSLAVTEFKWSDLLEYVTPQPTAYGVGGIVVSLGRFESLPPEARAILRRTAESASALFSQRVRSADEQAFVRLRGEKRVVEQTDADRAEWAASARTARERVRGSVLRAEIVDLVVAAGP